MRRVGRVGLGEREFKPLTEEGSGSRRRTTTRIRGDNLVDRRRLATVHKVPERPTALVKAGEHLTGIGHHHVLRGIPLEGVDDGTRNTTRRGIGVLGDPALDVAHLTATEPREGDRLGSGVGEGDDNLLLGELNRVGESVGGHVHTTGKSIALVIKNDLLDLELRKGEGRRDTGNRPTRRNGEDGRNRVEFASDLDLLGEEVRRERGELALRSGRGVGKGEPDIRTLGSGKTSTRHRLTAEGEDVIARRGVGRLAESRLEELLSREEILGRTSIAERDLLDERVTPPASEGKRRVVGGDGGEFKNQEHILDAVVGRDGEDGRTASQVRELLDVAGVDASAEALLLGGLGVGVVDVNALARANHLLDGFRKRGLHVC